MESFASFDGVRIAFDEMGTGDAVLLHHGFASDSQINWVRPGVAGAIATAGLRAVMIDARGHGRSEKPHDAESYAGNAMARDVQALLDHLEIGDVAVVGYSMGSFVAVDVAVSDPRVRRIVLCGVGSGQASVSNRARAGRIADALSAPDKATITDPTALAFRNFADATGSDREALAAVQRSRYRPPGPDVLGSIKVPTLVVNGEADTLVGPLDSFSEAIPGAQLVIVPGDHLSAVLKPEFREAVVEFLSAR